MGVLDHYLVVAKIKYLRKWCERRVGNEVISVLEVSERDKVRCRMDYKDKLKQRWEKLCVER